MALLMGLFTQQVTIFDKLFSNNKISLTGYAYDPDCMYINGTGSDYFEFYIQLNRCGTLGKNALNDEKRKNPTVRLIPSFIYFQLISEISFSFRMKSRSRNSSF